MRNHKRHIANLFLFPSQWGSWLTVAGLLAISTTLSHASWAQNKPVESLQGKTIGVTVSPADGSYEIFDPASSRSILHASVAVEVDHRWIKSNDYTKHSIQSENATDDLGSRESLTVTNRGLSNKPDLTYSVHLHSSPDFVTITATVRNSGARPITVEAIRGLEAGGAPVLDLEGSDASDRVLSDSFSEDRPGIVIHDLPDATSGLHRAVGSQLIYNRETKRSLFVGALSSDKFLTVLRLHIAGGQVSKYEVDSTGTTELTVENSLEHSRPEDRIELSLPLAPGAEISSERMLIDRKSVV